jgi:hypothetical protein
MHYSLFFPLCKGGQGDFEVNAAKDANTGKENGKSGKNCLLSGKGLSP